jgi:hypothetical protein
VNFYPWSQIMPSTFRRARAFATTALLSIAVALPSAAQTAGTATITGIVTDTSGAVIPNATVNITNTDTAAARTLQTNSDGSYPPHFCNLVTTKW